MRRKHHRPTVTEILKRIKILEDAEKFYIAKIREGDTECERLYGQLVAKKVELKSLIDEL